MPQAHSQALCRYWSASRVWFSLTTHTSTSLATRVLLGHSMATHRVRHTTETYDTRACSMLYWRPWRSLLLPSRNCSSKDLQAILSSTFVHQVVAQYISSIDTLLLIEARQKSRERCERHEWMFLHCLKQYVMKLRQHASPRKFSVQRSMLRRLVHPIMISIVGPHLI